MIICELHGGLGNQLLEYANARRLAVTHNLPLKFDITEITKTVYRLDKFNVPEIVEASKAEIANLKRVQIAGKVSGIFRRITGRPIYLNNRFHVDEATLEFDRNKLLKPENIYLSGYWFDQKYFIEIEQIIKKEFSLKHPLNKENLSLIEQIMSGVSVSLHIRRGDYLTNSYFENLSLDYYYNSLKYLSASIENFKVFIFSDDIQWVKENLQIDKPHVFVNVNGSETDFMELELMKSCSHNIIANSTFSWWGGWLNENPNKIVIAPRVWWANKEAQEEYENGRFVPSTWVKI